MFGTLVYMILDVSLNMLLWSSQKAYEGGSMLGGQIIKTYQEMNKSQMQMMIKEKETETETDKSICEEEELEPNNIQPPSYNNTLQHISIEDINTIKKQIECQSKIIEELEVILENQKKSI
jgi:hypothetical protein